MYFGGRCIMISLDVSSVVHLWIKGISQLELFKSISLAIKKKEIRKYEPSTHTQKNDLQGQQDVSVGKGTCYQV